MATFKLHLGLGMTVVIVGARLGFLNDASSSGATTAPMSEQ